MELLEGSTEYILAQIFSFLSQDGICLVAKVSKTWRKITLDYFPWTNAFRIQFSAPTDIEKKNLSYPLRITGFSSDCILFLNQVEIPVGSISSDIPFFSQLLEIEKKFPSCWKHKVKLTKGNEKNFISITMCVNLVEVEQSLSENFLLLQKCMEFSNDIIVSSFMSNYNRERGVMRPYLSFTMCEQPKRLNPEMRLYNYQLEMFSWMMHTEKDQPVVLDQSNFMAWRSRNFNLMFYYTHPIKIPLNIFAKLIPKGGVIADDDGLGKKVTVAALILANSQVDTKISELYEKVASQSGKKVELPIYNFEEYLDKDMTNLLFPSKATLVFCSYYMVNVWCDEIIKCSNNSLEIVTISSNDDLKMITYEHIMNADVVIVSYNLLDDLNYLNIGCRSSDTHKVRKGWVNRHLEEIRSDENGGLKQFSPVLDHFHFHRIILDKWNIYYSYTAVLRLNYSFVWIITIPVIQPNTYLTLLDVRIRTGVESYMASFILQNLTWRNTTKSVENDLLKINLTVNILSPITTEETKILKFSEVETVLYNEYSQFKDYPFLQPYETLTSRTKFCMEDLQIRIKNYVEFFETLQQSVVATEDTIQSLTNASLQRNLLNRETQKLVSLKAKVEQERQLIKNTIRSITQSVSNYARCMTAKTGSKVFKVKDLFESVNDLAIEHLIQKPNTEEDTLQSEELGDSNNKRKQNTEHKVMKKGKIEIKDVRTEEIQQFFIEHYGTKIGNILFYLLNLWNKDPTARVLIFSMRSKFLKFIAATLQQCGILCRDVDNLGESAAKISTDFRVEKKQRVLLANYNFLYHKINPVGASHIILDTIPGFENIENTKQPQVLHLEEYAKLIIDTTYCLAQKQKVVIVRFIVENTVEHEIYSLLKATKQTSAVASLPTMKVSRKSPIGEYLSTSKWIEQTGLLSQLCIDD